MVARLICLCLLLLASVSLGQPKNPPKKDDVPKGYQKLTIEGFTLLVSDEAMEKDKESKLKRTPLVCLEKEIQVFMKVMPADKLKNFRSSPIWVEWDERVAMTNGRAGGAVAVFYGGHQNTMLREGLNPKKANCVTILSLRSLADEHQPGTDSKRCVTLHELAHAYHFLVLGPNNVGVKTAYTQAMERKVFPRDVYAATNENEYFAEITCAYLDSLHYAPRNRAELKKADPKGFELMEKTWGRIAEKKGPQLPTPDLDGSVSLNVNLDAKLASQPIVGKLPERGSANEAVPTMILVCGINDLRSGRTLIKWHETMREVNELGGNVVASFNGPGAAELFKQVHMRHNITIPFVSDDAYNLPRNERFSLPHALVFDRAGKCIFRGNPLDAHVYMTIALGKTFFTDEFDSKSAILYREQFEAGAPISTLIAKGLEILKNSSGDSEKEMKELLTKVLAGGKVTQMMAEGMAKDEPVTAFFEYERLQTVYKGTSIGISSTEAANKLRSNPKVAAELRARTALEPIKKLDAQLSGKEGSFNPGNVNFRFDNERLLKQIGEAIEKFVKQYPGTKAEAEANRIADSWLLRGKK